MLKKLLLAIYIIIYISAQCQGNFKIGMFGASMSLKRVINGKEVPYETPEHLGYKTSPQNVLKEDGFNIMHTYEPNEWTSIESLKSYIKLTSANNFILALNNRYYFKPTINTNGSYNNSGVNIYDNCNYQLGSYDYPMQIGTFRINLNNYTDEIFTISPYKETIWGYQITEEASYYHWFPYKNDCTSGLYGDPLSFKNIEIPPTNVLEAINYLKLKTVRKAPHHKFIIMEANHGRAVVNNTIDGEGVFNPQNYINLLDKNDNRDVYFEGSYVSFPHTDWTNQIYSNISNNGFHYLGQFKSIDYAKQRANEVHKIINIESTKIEPHYWAHYHSNLTIQNANWLWFQAYTSIIHGVDGLWFWQLDRSINQDEIDNFSTTNLNRFNRDKFPVNYQKYISNLTKELSLLEKKGFLTNDETTLVHSKTDNADEHCIVPMASTYIPSYLPVEKRNENYGLRYTIRTNGNEVIMIITNPLNIPINTTLNFSNSSNQIIQNSTGVQILFEGSNADVTSTTYKTNRNSNINLQNLTYNAHNRTFTGNKSVNLSMGPLDVKILKFISQPLPINSDNAWLKTWSNNGNSKIGTFEFSDNSFLLAGDYDGDGIEELLCYNKVNSQMTDIMMLKYIDSNWQTIWSNNLTTSFNGHFSNLSIGDFDGDGRDEILVNSIIGTSKILKFTNNQWLQIWSDYGNNNHAINPYKGKIYVGDFDGDGKSDILGVAQPGWTTMFSFNNNDLVWKWSDMGNTNTNLYPYRFNLKVGDFDGDGIDEVLGLDGWATILKFQNNNWTWMWSNYGTNGLGGWSYPLQQDDDLLIGNLDNDSKEELFFIQNHTNGDWAATIDLKTDNSGWNWNWSANSLYSIPYINNWPINTNNRPTNYSLVKSQSNVGKQLIAIRKFCNSYLINMYRSNSVQNKRFENGNLSNIENNNYTIIKSSVYPNPTLSNINIECSELIKRIECYTIDGRQLFQELNINTNFTTISLPETQNAVYLIKVIGDNFNETHRIIKK